MSNCKQKFLSLFVLFFRRKVVFFLMIFFCGVPFLGQAATIGKPTNYVSLNSGLVGWWTFDQGDMGPNVRDRSGQGNHGNLSGQSATTSAEGKMGQALSFDGVNDKVVFTSTNYGTTHSISFWINYRDTSDGVVIGGVNNNYGAYVSSPGLAGLLYYSANSNNVNVGHSGFVKGQWYHITIVRSGTSVSFYKNGSQIGTTQTLASNDSLSLSTLGSYSIDTFFTGMLLDDVRIYNRTLSASEIGQLYRLGAAKVGVSSARSSGVIPNLVAHWTFDANDVNWSTGAVTDRSGNGNTAYVANIGTTTGIREGRIGQAFNFNGTNSKVTANSDVFGTGELTVSAWVRPNNGGEANSGIIVGTGQTHLAVSDERPYFSNIAGVATSYPENKTLPFKQWSHVTVTRYKNDWPVATSSPNASFWAFGLDETNDVLYAGSTAVLRCPLSNGCESVSDWTEVWNIFASASAIALSFVFDSVNGVMYVGAEPNIYRCAVSTGCDTSAEWTTATSTSGTSIYDLKIDTTNQVIYAAGGGGSLGGVVYRCVLSTGCDGAGEWVISYDVTPTHVTSLAFDSVNGVLYAATGGNVDAIIYRCAVSTGCDAAGDWTLTYDSSEIPTSSYLAIDPSLGALYAGIGFALYYCNTSSGCDGVNDWATTSVNYAGFAGMHVDTGRHKLFTRTANITVNDLYVCSIDTGCDADAEFTRLYASFEGAFESGFFVIPDSGHVYYGNATEILRCERGDACRLPYEPRMYINGQRVSLLDSAYDTPSLGSVTVIGNNAVMDSTFNGLIDDVRVYNRELTAGEVAAIAGAGLSKASVSQRNTDALANGLVGHWTFDGPDMRPNVRDRTGQGNHGNLIGQTATSAIEGKVGQAIRLDGVNDYINVPDNANGSLDFGSNQDFAYSFWVKLDKMTSNAFISKRAGSGQGYVFYNGAGDYSLVLFDGSNNAHGFNSNLNLNLSKGVWTHIVAVFDRDANVTVYKDGTFLNATSIAAGSSVDTGNSTSFQIGEWTAAGRPYGGTMDDVRVYNRTLSASEVQQLYNMGR